MFRKGRNRPAACHSRIREIFPRARIRLVLLFLGFLALVLQSACTSYELVQLPVRDADLYPSAESKAGLAVAIDQMSDSGRVRRHFGADLLDKGILPIQLIVSNHGDHRVKIRPSDVLMLRGRGVIDPLPIEKVTEFPKSEGLWVTDETEEQIDEYFTELAFKEMIVPPGETVRGVLFFEMFGKPIPRSRYFRLVSLFPQPSFQLHLVITDLEKKERIPFGPFGVYYP